MSKLFIPSLHVKYRQSGATLVEFCVVIIPLLLVALTTVQFALMSHAKSQVYYATYEATRVASAFDKENGETADSVAQQAFDRAIIGYFGGGNEQSEIDKSIQRRNQRQKVVLKCETEEDRYITCKATFGIPTEMQVPLAGQALTKMLQTFNPGGDVGSMISAGRIPVTATQTMHLSPVAMDTPPWKKEGEHDHDPEPFSFSFSGI